MYVDKMWKWLTYSIKRLYVFLNKYVAAADSIILDNEAVMKVNVRVEVNVAKWQTIQILLRNPSAHRPKAKVHAMNVQLHVLLVWKTIKYFVRIPTQQNFNHKAKHCTDIRPLIRIENIERDSSIKRTFNLNAYNR